MVAQAISSLLHGSMTRQESVTNKCNLCSILCERMINVNYAEMEARSEILIYRALYYGIGVKANEEMWRTEYVRTDIDKKGDGGVNDIYKKNRHIPSK